MTKLTTHSELNYPLPVCSSLNRYGFGRPSIPGAEAMRRKVRGFFYAAHISMVGGVLGSRKACRSLDPVDQPDTSSTALSLVASVGGFIPQSRSFT